MRLLPASRAANTPVLKSSEAVPGQAQTGAFRRRSPIGIFRIFACRENEFAARHSTSESPGRVHPPLRLLVRCETGLSCANAPADVFPSSISITIYFAARQATDDATRNSAISAAGFAPPRFCATARRRRESARLPIQPHASRAHGFHFGNSGI